jgi:hypothetical protein
MEACSEDRRMDLSGHRLCNTRFSQPGVSLNEAYYPLRNNLTPVWRGLGSDNSSGEPIRHLRSLRTKRGARPHYPTQLLGHSTSRRIRSLVRDGEPRNNPSLRVLGAKTLR